MGGDYRTSLGINTSEYEKGMGSAQNATKKFQKTADDTSKTVEALGKKSDQAAKLLDNIKSAEGAVRSVSNYRTQLNRLTKEIQDLTINYRGLSDEMKNSDLGKGMLANIQAMTVKASEYRDAIGDAQASIKVLASDTAAWDAMKMGINTASAALQGFVAMGVLGEKQTEKLVGVIAKLKAAEAMTNSVIAIGNSLQKQSALMMGISTIQAKALTRAKELEAVATGKASIAQKLFNRIASANPYLILAAGVITLVGALTAFSLGANKAKKGAKELAEAQDNVNKAMEDSRLESGKTIAKFEILRAQYGKLKTAAEKQVWIKKHQEEFKDLNLAITNINDADDIFIKHAADVVKAMRLRAEAAAIMTQYQEEYAKAYKKSLEIEQGKQSSFMSSNHYRKEWKEAGLGDSDVQHTVTTMQSTAGAYSQSIYSLTPSGVEKMKAYWKKKGEESMDAFSDGMSGAIGLMEQKIAEAERLEAAAGHFGTGNSGNGGNGGKGGNNEDEIKALEGSKKAVQDLISKTQQLRDAQVVGTEEWNKQNDQLTELNRQLDEILAKEHRLNNPIVALEKIEAPAIMTNNRVQAMEIPIEIKRDKLVEQYKKAGEELSRIQDWLDAGAISQREAQALVDKLNAELSKKGLKADMKLDLDVHISESSYAKAANAIGQFVSSMDTLGSLSNVISSLDSVYNSIKNLDEKVKDSQSGWETFMAYFEVAMNIFNGITTAIEAIGTVMKIADAVTKMLTASTERQSAANIKEAGTAATKATADITASGAAGALAAAEGGESVASIPYVGAFLAVAMIATIAAAIVGMIASLSAFAQGGVVGGTSFTGDKILARLNSGEVVLNDDQQNRLWGMINNNSVSSAPAGEVTFKIHGSDLVGTLNNYNHRRSKV